MTDLIICLWNDDIPYLIIFGFWMAYLIFLFYFICGDEIFFADLRNALHFNSFHSLVVFALFLFG